MRVDSRKPYKLVFSLCKHEYLGYLIEPHVVQLNHDNSFSLTYQRLFSNTAADYAKGLDEQDLTLIKLCEEIEQSQLIKRYYKKKIRPTEYFTSVFDAKIFGVIRPKIDHKIHKILSLLTGKSLYLMSKEGWPVDVPLKFADSPTSVLFHFRRSETELKYFPTLKQDGMRMEFMFKEAEIIISEPACLLLENTLYFFDQDVDGKKLSPFLNKRFISIPRSAEQSYFRKFVTPLIEKHHVYAEGFDIITQQHQGVPVLEFNYLADGGSELKIKFRYGPYEFSGLAEQKVSVKLEHDAHADTYTFYRIKRSVRWEEGKIKLLRDKGLLFEGMLFSRLKVQNADEQTATPSLVDWLNEHIQELKDNGFEVEQRKTEKHYVFGSMELDFDIQEGNDWFDIKAMVQFGEYSIPFISLRKHILNREREFTLPSGEIALIPEQWFTQFVNFFNFVEGDQSLKLRKRHIGVISELEEGDISGVSMRRKIEKLASFQRLEEIDSPVHFHGTLRPYQKAGYNWFQFLKRYRFGGCLADDMGLGKTVQTLALLQKEKEESIDQLHPTSLIIMPTSLVYNWLSEAAKFAPDLLILNHTGAMRTKSSATFVGYDLVISTYGTARIDEQLLSDFLFHYIILDESQNIKNVSSKSFRAIKQLKSLHKLILSGTPVENSVEDLWSQMSFINPGLLGSHTFFKNEFVIPIEKKKDEAAAKRLQALIKPFVLRRTKAQVATELPEKSEKIFYCGMTDEQSDCYEAVKAEYRNLMLEQLEGGTFKRTGIQVLQGLSKLRQLANHPQMIDPEYKHSSGKFENVIQALENVLSKGHKVLLFSQFVKQMKIYAEHFSSVGIPFAYLDGSTKNRQEVVNSFREQEDIKVFLISIKAGGVGLNLTEADYVFILDPWWNPAVEMQAIDRTHRIGQTKNVFIYKFITKDSVEEKILALQARKKGIADSLIRIEESFVKSLTHEDISELLS